MSDLMPNGEGAGAGDIALVSRADFPIFEERPELIYLDSAATTQKPAEVLEAVDRFYRRTYSNVHRSVYALAEEATALYEGARQRVARFINSPDPAQIIFTRGTTEGINLVAAALAERISAGDEILVTILEHHSNLLPWRRVALSRGARLVICPITPEGAIDPAQFKELLSSRTRIAAFTMVSNVLGTIVSARELVQAAMEAGALTVLDAAQAAPSLRLDVVELGCDFLSFSGHKMLGPMGIGVLYGRRELLEQLPPFMTGGEMVARVTLEDVEWADVPHKFEAGTPNVAGAIGLAAAMDYLEELGLGRVLSHEQKLAQAAREGLSAIAGVRVMGSPANSCGMVSFSVSGVHAHDVAEFLAERNIAVRAGQLCAEPLLNHLGESAVVRASFYVYNTMRDVARLLEAVRGAAEFFR